ncbi:DUF6503 family protein [Aquimarina mytili]|uniref:Heat-shock protein Hsp90 n=1 Tax=Aquimarina mytili TaxID=874423 RepID=A0A937A355_9FLAO|nr:DUF6503 family protein [Aquimarina mytili]MBL0684095.1 hypothetical protein [Aquimarina mytili]
MKNLWIVILTITLISCNQQKKEENQTTSTDSKSIPVEPDGGIGDGGLSIENVYVQSIEKAHKKDEFLKHKAISFNANILFGGKEHLNGKITMLTNSTKIRIDKHDESKLIYNGEKVFLCPENANEKGARFDMFTWTYFFGLPYKLSDPGTKWELQNPRSLDDTEHQTARLTFEKGTGDAPDDWYVLYSDTQNVLQAAAYIVSFGSNGDTSKAEADPHAIRYKDFKMIDGIPFATKWEFYGWTQEKGMTEKLGEATITDITFLEEEGTIFDTPDNAKEITL